MLAIASTHEARIDWEYVFDDPALAALYDKAKRLQWNAAADVDWTIEVDPERFLEFLPVDAFNTMLAPPRRLTRKEVYDFQLHQLAWLLSQFLHGEQGALLATARIVDAVPRADTKLFAAIQVTDEARHVEVYRRYLTEKLPLQYPVNPHLKELLSQILREPRWDMIYLGMQIMIEGIALAAFGLMHFLYPLEPLLLDITARVMRDEARHVAFGLLSLDGVYAEMTAAERKEREDFVIEAARLIRERLLMQEVWTSLGFDSAAWSRWSRETPFAVGFRKLLFAKIVPNVKRLGLLTPRVRRAFEQLGILGFELGTDSSVDEQMPVPPPELLSLLTKLGTGV
jgi:hypothetical protein